MLIMTEKEHYDIEKRLSRYYETEEIDIDLANQIHADASKLFRRLNELEKGIEEVKDILFWEDGSVAVRKAYNHLDSLFKSKS